MTIQDKNNLLMISYLKCNIKIQKNQILKVYDVWSVILHGCFIFNELCKTQWTKIIFIYLLNIITNYFKFYPK